MKLAIITIAKDAMPWITLHYPEFRKLECDWTWHVVEGTAAPEQCTSWCARLPIGLSQDGTTGYLESLSFDPRVRYYRSNVWPGKVAMVNEPLKNIFEPCLLLQVDSDELWTANQIRTLIGLFSKEPLKNAAYFWCRYFVGPNIVITSRDTYGNNSSYEWHRAWRFKPGMRFKTHEPPVIDGLNEVPFTHKETERSGLVFDHFAYATEAQVAFKQKYYGSPNNENGQKYANAVGNWRRLQQSGKVKFEDLEEYLPWVGKGVKAERTI